MLQVINVSKSFSGKEAIKNINLEVKKGTIMGLVGPNGAGKSTLLRTIVDIYDPDGGKIQVNGYDIKDNFELKQTIGYVADRNDFFNSYKINDIVKYYKFAYKNFDIDKFYELNAVFEIPLNKKLSKLSKGNASRVAFMFAMSLAPELLVLDEPTSGLDPIVKRKFLQLLVEDVSERGTTVVISSHNLSDLESICDQVVFLNDGEILKDNTLDNLKTSMKKLQIIFKDTAPSGFECWPEFINVTKLGRSYNIVTDNYSEELLAKLKDNGALFIEELNLTLEDMLIFAVEK
ncbi:ABC transporter ATP-binding protein [Clostridium sp. YIM B02515]|uniref:ABC transporter ATP-binding protein n=1 Tax=Clostridium rhizosphaerae TaxID=2803861 RepID=A0ABS1TED1_9CLOT|nr:ABC transporter ATP-binding protein [Clostridium rhizosphaerae]MBL4937117.1 ABC transporter ATP-binding protein [Clostridium rhizosphaerae]